MKIGIGSDHAGFDLKEAVVRLLTDGGHEVTDAGTDGPDSVDYPDVAGAVAALVAAHTVERAILICGSGVGVSVAANKFPGIRAAVCHDTYSARQGVEHDDMNVLVLGARIIGIELAREVAAAFLSARFSGEARHQRRLRKVWDIEARNFRETP